MHPRSRSGSVSSAQSAPLPSPMSFRSVGGSRSNGLGPCGATPHLFLFAQGTSILCLQYESLAVEKRFESHLDEVTVISVDNNSDSDGEGSRVVTVDASKLAIVWDTRTGHEIARYASSEEIRSAAWMKNGNLAFGDAMGNVTLFDPLRSEYISARTIFDPLCTIAPAADCKTFALGYANGSVLVVALSPAFTILHTLTTTSLQPSEITTLAWHASASRQKSDMLATQTRDGDLRVWSVPKSLESDEPARVVRILKKLDNNRRGDNWMAWSRNGRIVQYSDGETTIWDVRTKKVTWETVNTLQNVFGITVYGPKGVLFTLGEDHTVQQFALYPPTLLANVQHLPALPPPSPPVSIEERRMEEEEQYHNVFHHLGEEEDYLTANMSPLGRIAHELEQLERMEHEHDGLGISNVPAPRAASISSRSSTASTNKGHNHSGSTSSSKGTKRSSGDQSELSQTTTTTISTGRKPSIGSASMNSPNRLPHPLRQEIYRSPEDEKVSSPIREGDLFAGLRARLVSVTYESPRIGSPKGNMTEDDHRKEMLYCIFGWRGDIEHLITDQLDSVDSRSMSAVMLRMWLGDLDQNSLAVLLGADFMVAGDWMFLALSAMGGQKSWNHVVRAFVMRLLQRGDLHTAVLCLLALGDKNDAVEVYVSHKWYMEAVLLVSLLWKKDWKRQSQLVRKWGEHCAENAEGALAARCFACAGSETPTERTTTPMTRTHSRSKSETESIQNIVRGLSISAPSNPRATLRMTPKNSPLKLITAFPSPTPDPIPRSATTSPSTEGKMGGVQRFFAWAGDRTGNKTPLSATATPIAMSAISPVDGYYRRDPFAAMSAKTVIPGAAKLPPVTEMSPDTPKQHNQPPIEKLLPPPEEKGIHISSPIEARNSMGFSESRGPIALGEHRSNNNTPVPGMGSRAVTPSPHTSMAMAPAPPPPPPPPPPPARRASPPIIISQKPPTPPMSRAPTSPLPTPPLDAFNNTKGPGARKPVGLAIQSVQWPPMDTVIREGTPPVLAGSKHKRTGSRNTPPVANIRPPARAGANDLDGFLTLLDNVNNKRMDTQRAAAPRLAVRRRAESPDARGRDRSRNGSRQRSTDRRGRQAARQEIPLGRSPSSPLPMSPQARLYREDIEEEDLHERDFEDERYYTISPPPPQNDSRHRVASRSRQRSRQRSRGRGESRRPTGSAIRSPSSPLPSSAQAQLYRDEGEDSFDDERYYTSSPPPRNASRARSRGRSNTRNLKQSYHIRSPSSPLPMSPEALMYAEMANDFEQEERHPRRPRPAIREESRNRLHGGGMRRSRSEHVMRQWSDQLEHAGALERRPSVSGISRKISIRGLPSNPRAWRNELGSPSRAGSRAGSPTPHPRSASPAMSLAMAPAPPAPFQPPSRAMSPAVSTLGAVSNGPRTMSPGPRTMSPAPRTMSPGPRQMTPGPRQMTPGPRQMTPGPRQMTPGPRQMTPGPRQMTPGPRTFSPPPSDGGAGSFASRNRSGSDAQSPANLPAKESIVRLQNHYYEEPDHYDPTRKPVLPDAPNIPFGGNHSRDNSASDPNVKPLIRKLPPQAPPDSPPPLPHDLPVHPALQMHLDPSQPGRKGAMARGRSVRRVQRNEEFMTPIDSVLRDHEHIIVGIDSDEAALRWEEENRYNQQQAQRYQQEMQQLRRHGQSPSISSQRSGHSGHGQHFGLRDSSEAIGSINQF